jgi:MFS family permease
VAERPNPLADTRPPQSDTPPENPPRASADRARRVFPPALRALNHRNFQLFFAGQLISMVGTWMQSVAQAWLVYKMTGSAALLGAVGFASQIPVFLLAPVGGALADRYSRHRMVVLCQSAAMLLAFVLAAATLSGFIQVWHIFVLASLLGAVNAFDLPARQSFVIEMVGRRDLINAIALNSSIVNGARIVGPAVAGVLIAVVGEGLCFLSNAVSYVAVITALLLMKVPRRVPVHDPRSALANVTEGFRFVARTAPVRALMLLLGLVSLMGMPYAVLMPIFADRVLGGGAQSLGLLMGATGIGALAGALSLTFRTSIHGLGRVVAFASAGFGVSLVLFSFSRSFWVSAALLIPAGFSMMVQMASSNTLIQSMVPDQLRGRVMAVYSMMFMGMAPFGAMFAGLLADRLGAPATVALGGSTCLAGAALFGAQLPALRAQARELIVAQQMAGGDPAEDVTGSPIAAEQASPPQAVAPQLRR